MKTFRWRNVMFVLFSIPGLGGPESVGSTLAKGVSCPMGIRESIAAFFQEPEMVLALTGKRPGTEVTPAPSARVKAAIQKWWRENGFRLADKIPHEAIASLQKKLGLSRSAMLVALADHASGYSQPPESEYPVGVAFVDVDGGVFFGVNLELPRTPQNTTMHGETFGISLAASRGYRFVEIALSAAPCGHCRQAINETLDSHEVVLHAPGYLAATPFLAFLPLDFGPNALGIKEHALLGPQHHDLVWARRIKRDDVREAAVEAARHAYDPYTGTPAGVAIEMSDGEVFTGSYQANVNFNAGTPPLQAALVQLIAARGEWTATREERRGRYGELFAKGIRRGVLAQRRELKSTETSQLKARPSFVSDTQTILNTIAPDAVFEHIPLDYRQP